MKNTLIVSDIHLGDHIKYNPVKDYRLLQYKKLVEHYVYISNQYSCDTIFIAGDILHVPVNEPKTIKVLTDFITTLSTNFDKVYYILGQHDLSTKSKTVSHTTSDSLIHIYQSLLPNVFYMDGKFLERNGEKFYFRDWYPGCVKFEESFDTFIGHVCYDYQQSGLYGEEIDTSKFKRAFLGDIHKPSQLGNVISIGHQIQNQIDENPVGTCIVYKGGGNFERINLDNNYLKLIPEHKEEFSGYVKEENIWRIYKPVLKEKQNLTGVVDVTESDIHKFVVDYTKDASLHGIHTEVLSTFDLNCESVDFNFKLQDIEIYNFKNIKYVKIDLQSRQRFIKFFGANGSGKSSFSKAIVVGLCGVKQKAKTFNNRVTKQSFKITVNIQYQNKIFTVTRTPSELQVYINREPVKSNNKRELESKLLKHLPFLKYFNFLTYSISDVSFLSERKNDQVVEFISKLYGFDYIENLHNRCQPTLQEEKNFIQKLQDRLQLVQFREKEINTQITELNKKVENTTFEKLTTCIQKLRLDLTNFEKHNSVQNLIETLEKDLIQEIPDKYIEELQSEIRVLQGKVNNSQEIQKIENKYTELKELGFKLKYVVNLAESFNLKYEKNSTGDIQLSVFDTEVLVKYNQSKNELNKWEKKIRNKDFICSTCGSVLEDLSVLQTRKDKSNIQYLNCTKEFVRYYSICKDRFGKLVTNLKKLQTILHKHTKIKNEFQQKQLKLENVLQLKNNREKQLERIANYKYELQTLHKYKNIDKIDTNNKIECLTLQRDSFSQIDSLRVTYEETLQERQDIVKKLKNTERLDKLKLYSDVTKKSGALIKSLLQNFLKNFDNTSFKFNLTSTRANGDEYMDVSVHYKSVKSGWTPYELLSDGEKCLCNVYFFNQLPTTGLFIFDEFFKTVDNHNFNTVLQMLPSIKANNIFVITHDVNFVIESDSYEVVRDEEDFSKYILT